MDIWYLQQTIIYKGVTAAKMDVGIALIQKTKKLQK
jgi:hypothetical protein